MKQVMEVGNFAIMMPQGTGSTGISMGAGLRGIPSQSQVAIQVPVRGILAWSLFLVADPWCSKLWF